MKEYAKAFYKSKAWQDTRNSYAKSKHGLCEECLKNGRYNAGVIVHHKIFMNQNNINDPNIALNWNNLELLCRDCHGGRHKNKKRFKLDEVGRVIF